MNKMTETEFLIAAAIAVGCILALIVINVIVNSRKKGQPSLPKEEAVTSSDEKSSIKETSLSEGALAETLTPSLEPSGWLMRLHAGLQRTRTQLFRGMEELFTSSDSRLARDTALEGLFEVLIKGDVGVDTTNLLLGKVRVALGKEDYVNVEVIRAALKHEILTLLSSPRSNPKGVLEDARFEEKTPERSGTHIVLMVGVNGVGKTTSTGKLAYKSRLRGQKVVVGAGDTFRAAAVEQLAVWADRAGAPLIRLKEGADPASVAFEAVKKAAEMQADVCFIDTAGRLQNRKDLMDELSKIVRVVSRGDASAPHEVLLVVDATTGQNALQQAKLFSEAAGVTGIVLTKLDGTAKGGVALAVSAILGLPIRYVGVGEAVEDLEVFKPEDFVEALFRSSEASEVKLPPVETRA